jgi:hypothetical protein
MPQVDSHRSQQVENWLDHHGVTWEYEHDLDMSRIDIEKSLSNQARVNQLDDERVGVYTEALARGDEFPAIVVHRASARRYVTTDGNRADPPSPRPCCLNARLRNRLFAYVQTAVAHLPHRTPVVVTATTAW